MSSDNGFDEKGTDMGTMTIAIKTGFNVSRSLISGALAMAPASVFAHTGVGGTDGFLHGLIHPLAGWDHLLAMTAVGLWVAQQGGRALWAVPAAFVTVMVLGALLGMAGVTVPFSEAGILASVILLGVFVAVALRLFLWLSMPVVGLFALFHGFAHGAEMPVAVDGLTYNGGFVLATLLLHGCGMAAGLILARLRRDGWLRSTGAAVVASGLILALD